MNVISVRCGVDNLAYLAHRTGTRQCLVIDPGEAGPVLAALQQHALEPECVLATHAHADHTAGAAEIRRHTGVALRRLEPGRDRALDWSGGRLAVLHVPGHTPEHVAFHDAEGEAIFCGDVLFVAGCGRAAAGCMIDLWYSLLRLAELPDSTRVFPGHDYTAENLAFAAHLDPSDQRVAERLARAQSGDALVPSTIGEERRTNPFLRCADPAYRARIGRGGLTPEVCFAQLRSLKNRWS